VAVFSERASRVWQLFAALICAVAGDSTPAPALEVRSEIALSAQDVAVKDGLVYVADAATGLRVLDVSEASPREVASLDVGGARSVAVAAELVVLGGFDERLRFVDVSDPGHPSELAFLEGVYATHIEVAGTVAYVGDRNRGLLIIDLRDPRHPTVVGNVPKRQGWFPLDVEVRSGVAYVAEGFGGMRMVDVSDPAAPVELGIFSPGGNNTAVAVGEGLAYLIVESDLWVIEVSSPRSPSPITRVRIDLASDLALSGDLLYAAHRGVLAIDVSEPSAPVPLGSLSTPGLAQRIALAGEVAYLADNDGLRVVDLSRPETPRRIATMPRAEAASIQNGIAYLLTGAYFNLYDVSDPTRPEWLHGSPVGSFAQIQVVGEIAYFVSHLYGLQAWDVSDPTTPSRIATLDLPHPFFRDLAVRAGIAYALNDREGLITVDVSDPSALARVGWLDAFQNPWRLAVRGHLIYVADHTAGLRVVDASDPADLRLVATLPLPGRTVDVAVAGDFAYVLGLESGMWIVDLADPVAPSVIGLVATGGGAQDIEIEGALAYVSGGTRGSIQVIDISVPSAPIQKAGYQEPIAATRNGEVSDGIFYDLSNGHVIDFGPTLAPSRQVEIDIDPSHEPNEIRPGSPRIVHVAVIGSETFDAAAIDPETLSFGPSGAGPVGRRAGFGRDVNRDAFVDWVAGFRTSDTGIALGDEEACIAGVSADGRRFRGCDAIVTLSGCGRGFEASLALIALPGLRAARRRCVGRCSASRTSSS